MSPVRPASPAALLATRLAFFIAGLGGACWAPLIPFVKARCGLTDGALGLLLLCLGAGSIVAMPAAAVLAGRVGCRAVIVLGTAAVCLTPPILAWTASVPLLAAVLFLFGTGVGTVDCIVNVQAVIVERASGRILMSGLHALFSIGGISGALGVSALLHLGLSPVGISAVAVLVIIAALLLARPGLLAEAMTEGGPPFAVPRGIVLAIGLMCFVVFLTEGAAIDWSGVMLTTIRGVDVTLVHKSRMC